ncbi:acyl-CoA dehydrogenase family protein [Halomicrobium sp. HM KBTZ05]|uniref:acyl-CoA dehydrogenase family protein n=1 Tax=Halomicrobium sp. HM KBTZ05 TaxID=3242663 RepID=UPI0035570563
MELSSEQRAIRDTVREVADEEIRPVARECDREQTFPEDAWDTLAEIDVTGLTVPEAYGGLDVDRQTYAVVNEAVAHGSLAVATALSVHCLATSCVATFGDEQLREAWLPDMVAGRPVGAFALSEPEAGSNPRQMQTVARREGDEYVIDGEKAWITNGQRSGVVIVFAKTDPDDPDSVTQFLVPKDSDGLTVGSKEEKLGLRASDTTTLTLDGVRVPDRYRLTEEGRGLAAALSILTGGRVGIAAQAVGLSQAALDETVDYVTEREQFDGPIGDIQSVRHTIAEMETTVRAGRELTHAAARAMDRDEDTRASASVAKYFATEGAVDVTQQAVQLHGGYGYTTEFDVERFYRDAKVTTIYEGTSQIQKNVIARSLLS